MSAKKLVFVFPGQGAQTVGMGCDLFDHSPAAKLVFEAVDEACACPVSKMCFIGPEEALRETRNTQPALFAASVAALATCMEAELMPAAVAGHSVGECAALVAAEAFDIPTGARLVKARAEAMAEAAAFRAGTMAAVLGLDNATVAAVCNEISNQTDAGVVVVANFNAPGQVVISGETPAVEAASARLKESGAKRVVPLAVSGAFHSPLMELASAVMRGVLERAEICDPRLPIIANVTADYEKTAGAVRANLAAQVAGPVRWVETIQRFVTDGYDTFVECGPGNVLAGLIKRIAPGAVVYGVSDRATLAAAREALLA
jgi:[acyl-carrier-protein] S-malonyltransferase